MTISSARALPALLLFVGGLTALSLAFAKVDPNEKVEGTGLSAEAVKLALESSQSARDAFKAVKSVDEEDPVRRDQVVEELRTKLNLLSPDLLKMLDKQGPGYEKIRALIKSKRIQLAQTCGADFAKVTLTGPSGSQTLYIASKDLVSTIQQQCALGNSLEGKGAVPIPYLNDTMH